MSDASPQPATPPPAPATKVPKAKKDIALQSCIRLLFFMHESMKAQGVEKSGLGVAVAATIKLCSHALPNGYKLSITEASAIHAAAQRGAQDAAAAVPAGMPQIIQQGAVPTLPKAGQGVILNPGQIRKPSKP